MGEEAYQADLVFTPKRGTTFSFNYSRVNSLKTNGDINGNPKHLFSERYLEVQHKINKKSKIKFGAQSIYYDQQRYEQKDTSYKDVQTDFSDFLYRDCLHSINYWIQRYHQFTEIF